MFFKFQNPNRRLEEIYEANPSLFNGLITPSVINKELLIKRIMSRCARLYPYWQDATILSEKINSWSSVHQQDWAKAYKAATEDYNPIYNYYREETGGETIEKHRGTKTQTQYNDTDTPGVTVKNVGSVVAYDSNTESETGQSVSSQTGTNSRQGSTTVTVTDADANTFDKDVHNFQNRVTQGNVGVTKSQDMVRDEVELRISLSIQELIAASFEEEFCIQTY